ncbi:phage tail protein [Rugamonas rivuli]|uniref:Phage tail protein n=1 Tax=Rugamonas rivuli TaxID=2743358 RepID=A0A843SE44_9BURK|nr:tail fiber protein [Rugamonas rivuli]MQA22529.1 phage tail protein [Rugamonas rivuli]
MSDQFIGEIRTFAFNFMPQGWAVCNGQLLSIQQNTALFAVLGTTYGGDGRATFGLPNLQGRMPLHVGGSQAPGLSERSLGEQGGVTSVTLGPEHLPQHTHSVNALTAAGTQAAPGPSTLLADGGPVPLYTGFGGGMAARGTSSAAGSSQAHNNMPPYLALNFCIALQGEFPAP